MLNECIDVMEAIQPLVEDYKKDNWDVSMERDDAQRLFDKINSLRGSIGALMCCYMEEIGMSNLSDLLDGVPYIQYEKDEEDE